MTLGVHSKASNLVMKQELGCFPLHLIIYTRIFIDCKTVGFFSKSVKKSVKCGVRVLCAQASHTHRVCEARESF